MTSADSFVDSVWRCLVAEQTTPEQVVAFALRLAAVLHDSGVPLSVCEDLRLRLCQLAIEYRALEDYAEQLEARDEDD
jgi:hypothetical protein